MLSAGLVSVQQFPVQCCSPYRQTWDQHGRSARPFWAVIYHTDSFQLSPFVSDHRDLWAFVSNLIWALNANAGGTGFSNVLCGDSERGPLTAHRQPDAFQEPELKRTGAADQTEFNGNHFICRQTESNSANRNQIKEYIYMRRKAKRIEKERDRDVPWCHPEMIWKLEEQRSRSQWPRCPLSSSPAPRETFLLEEQKNRAVSGQARGQRGRSDGHKPQKRKNIMLIDSSPSE